MWIRDIVEFYVLDLYLFFFFGPISWQLEIKHLDGNLDVILYLLSRFSPPISSLSIILLWSSVRLSYFTLGLVTSFGTRIVVFMIDNLL